MTAHFNLDSFVGVVLALITSKAVESFVTEVRVKDGWERGFALLGIAILIGLVYNFISKPVESFREKRAKRRLAAQNVARNQQATRLSAPSFPKP